MRKPMAILAVVVCLVLAKLASVLPARRRAQGVVVYFIWLAVVIVPFTLGPAPAAMERHVIWQKEQLLRSSQVLEAAISGHKGEGDVYIRNSLFTVFILGNTPDHFPGLAALFVVLYPNNIVDGKRVYFLEESAEIVQNAKAHASARISELLVHAPAAEAKK